MVRGTQKQIIHLKNTDSPLFEEAFLIVKQYPQATIGPRSMVEEANRLLSADREDLPSPQKQEKRGTAPLTLFVSGAIVGAAVCALLFLFF